MVATGRLELGLFKRSRYVERLPTKPTMKIWVACASQGPLDVALARFVVSTARKSRSVSFNPIAFCLGLGIAAEVNSFCEQSFQST